MLIEKKAKHTKYLPSYGNFMIGRSGVVVGMQ